MAGEPSRIVMALSHAVPARVSVTASCWHDRHVIAIGENMTSALLPSKNRHAGVCRYDGSGDAAALADGYRANRLRSLCANDIVRMPLRPRAMKCA